MNAHWQGEAASVSACKKKSRYRQKNGIDSCIACLKLCCLKMLHVSVLAENSHSATDSCGLAELKLFYIRA